MSILNKHKENNSSDKYIGYIVIGIIIIVGLICNHCKNQDLTKCHKFTIGKITDIQTKFDGPNGTRYIYFIDGKKYIGLIVGKYYENLQRKKFPLVFSCSKPDYSKMLIEPSDFEEYGYIFPDSLKWVLPLIHDK
jgi:hypothetical protein